MENRQEQICSPMPSLDSVDFVENPQKEICEEIVAEIVRTDDWTRIQGEFDIWKETQDYFLFLVAIDKETKRPVGSISLTMDKSPTDPEDHLYYIGSFYTKLSHRNIGLGLELFKRCMAKTGDKNVNLNSAITMIDFYEKRFGFDKFPPYHNAFAKFKPEAFNKSNTKIYASASIIKNVDEIDFGSVISYDQSICTRQRTKYLHRWLTGHKATSKVALDRNGKVIGIICIRPQIIRNRLTVGPFYAECNYLAHDLLLECIKKVPNFESYEEIWMRFPEPNDDGIRLILNQLTDGSYTITRNVKSMFTKRLIEPDPNRVFSVMEAGHSLV